MSKGQSPKLINVKQEWNNILSNERREIIMKSQVSLTVKLTVQLQVLKAEILRSG